MKENDDKTIGSFGAALGLNILIILGTVGISYLFPSTGGVFFIGYILISFFGGILLNLIGTKYSAIGKGLLLSTLLFFLVGFSVCLANPIIGH